LGSAAFVAVTEQVPVEVEVRVDEEMEQLPEFTTKVRAPTPDPPEVVSERDCP
jgi:hypothetical protein